MSEKFKPKEKQMEKFKETNLSIREPDGLHQGEIIFEENNANIVAAYNVAIHEICNQEHNMGMFHQTGIGNNPGYHAWEVLGSAAEAETLTALLSKIHQKAKKNYEIYKEMGL